MVAENFDVDGSGQHTPSAGTDYRKIHFAKVEVSRNPSEIP